MRNLFSALLLLAVTSVHAQSWVELREQGAPFEEIQAAFYQEWEGKTPEKGQGYKQFKRWESFVEPRILNGDVAWTEMDMLRYQEYEKAQDNIAIAKRTSLEKSNANWTPLGPDQWINSAYAPGNGRINVVAVHPTNSNIYYIGSPAGGLWKTENNGGSWTPLTDHLPTPGVGGIAINPTDPDIIYIGTGDANASDSNGIGVLKSTDGGDTWNTTGLSWPLNDNIRVHKLMMHPTDPETLFACSSNGLWKTTTGGLVWYRTVSGSIRDIEFKPNDPNTIYIGRDRFFVSTDGGENFDNIDEGLPGTGQIGRISIAVTPDDEDYVYLLMADDDQAGLLGVYRSVDSGQTFEETFTSPNILSSDFEGDGEGGQGWYDLAIAVNPNNKNNVFCGGVNLWESNDGGESFDMNAYWVFNTPGTEYVHADIHQLDFYNDIFYCTSDGGIWTSSNFGNSFTNRSFGLEITQGYRIGVDPQNANRYVIGTQDNGTVLKANSWYHVQGGDGMQCFFHPTDDDKVYVSSQFGALYRSDNGGNDFEWAAGGINDQGAWTTPWELDINNPSVMYAGYQNVWKSLTGGASWTQVTADINETIRFIDVSPINGQRVYVST
ncbi:MAG: hypothetical protein AAF193_04905 [Bacteroidota bacterium]